MSRRYTLLAEGSTDQALLPLLNRCFEACGAIDLWDGEFTRKAPRESLAQGVQRAVDDFPCDLLFVHRDADNAGFIDRRREIEAALSDHPALCVIPVERLETWLLVDEAALRVAAANSKGREPLSVPGLSELERRANTKELLTESLKRASGLRGRRLDDFERRIPNAMARLAEEIAVGPGFERLQRLSAFVTLQKDLGDALKERGW